MPELTRKDTLEHTKSEIESYGFDPTKLTKEQATKMGLYVYKADLSGGTNDIAYYSGNKATITNVNNVTRIDRVELIPKQRQNGTWELFVYITGISTSNTNVDFTVDGIDVITGTSGADTPLLIGKNTASIYGSGGVNNPNTFNVRSQNAGTSWRITGTVQLDAIPTWAWR